LLPIITKISDIKIKDIHDLREILVEGGSVHSFLKSYGLVSGEVYIRATTIDLKKLKQFMEFRVVARITIVCT
jgi:hypothetical protein